MKLCSIILSFYSIAFVQASGFIYYREVNMYYKYHEESEPWHRALDSCISQNSTLALPKNEAEMNVLTRIFNDNPHLDLEEGVHPNISLLGFHDLFQEGEYLTVKGDPVQEYYHKWELRQPDNAKGLEDCGSMTRNGKINDYNCIKPAHYICQKDGEVLEFLDNRECGTRDTAYRCSEDLNICYKFHKNPKPWSLARTICHAEGGHLPIIRTKPERDYLSKIFKELSKELHFKSFKDYTWLGFHDMFKENHFLTVLDEYLYDVGFVTWLPGQPDNFRRREHCGAMHRSGLFNDFYCSHNLAFFCQKPIHMLYSQYEF